MKGDFEYTDSNDLNHKVTDSDDIPASAKNIVLFHIRPPDPPHSAEDHELIEKIGLEFDTVFERVYGFPPRRGEDNAGDRENR